MKMLNDPWDRIIQKWQVDNIPLRKGVSLTAIAKFESKYQVVLPRDVREYFTTVDGTGDHLTEEWYFRFWPLAEVKSVHEILDARNPDQFSYPDCFVFADHLVSSWVYAVKLTREPHQLAPVFEIHGGYPPSEVICDSFREFMSRYADDDKNII
jgi:hypothetical protein